MEAGVTLGLNRYEWQTFLRVTQHPSLWPFTVAAGEAGVDAALEACRTRRIPEEAREKFERAHWTEEHLPEPELLDSLAVGIRWRHHVLVDVKNGEDPRPLARAARQMGIELPELHRGISALANLGWTDPQAKLRSIIYAYRR